MNAKIVTLMAVAEVIFMIGILVLGVATYNEVRRDPLDVNRDGEANIIDLSVLAAELNERGQ